MMRNKHYKVKTFRISEEIFKEMKEQKRELSWNLYFRKLVNKNEEKVSEKEKEV